MLVAIRRREAAVGAVRGPGETGRYDRSGDYLSLLYLFEATRHVRDAYAVFWLYNQKFMNS
ncbi:hypothetical protein, partial [Pseudomonas aeruginosa]|uniref:hypothetical protein n=1 Tax=Pseudomonas aeruginosa TaxID=287 RepID=UPI003D2BCC64